MRVAYAPAGTGLIGVVLILFRFSLPAFAADQSGPETFIRQITALEIEFGGRIGVAALDTGTGGRLEYRADERFAMCSTFKLLLVSAVLARSHTDPSILNRTLPFSQDDMVEYSPVTASRLQEKSMSIFDLCAACVIYSDNTAANLLIGFLGGPAAVTSFTRSLGDRQSRLDRTEPALNTNYPGDNKDTTTPSAMLGSMNAVLTGNALPPRSREQLITWMCASATGGGRIRSGVEAGWRVGSKSGSGGNGATNDLAIIWPPGRPPILVAVYYSESPASPLLRDQVVARAARAVLDGFGIR